MGNICCKGTGISSPPGSGSSVQHNSNALILGLDGVGKTLLLYNTYMQSWRDCYTKVEHPSYAYHYEIINRNGFTFGLWDLPGISGLRPLWSRFYSNIRITGIIYIVNLMDEDASRMAESRRILSELLNVLELGDCSFLIVLNTFDVISSATSVDPDKVPKLLGITDCPDEYKPRIQVRVCNVKNGEQDREYAQGLAWLIDRMAKAV